MKRLIILPKFYVDRHTDNYRFLFMKMRKELGFTIIYTDTPDPAILNKCEIIILYSIPHQGVLLNYPLKPFLALPKRVRLIGFLRDVHCFDESKKHIFLTKMNMMLDRFDTVLHFSDEYFKNAFPNFVNKATYFPQFFATYTRYRSKINRDCKNKILLSGEYNKYYPIRNKVFTSRAKYNKIIDIVKSGKKAGNKHTGDSYAKLLMAYYGGLATGGASVHYAVAKYLEIPAAGALLLGEELQDTRTMGFIPWKHFVPVTIHDVLDKIQHVVSHRDKFENMREACKDFVWERHGLDTRFNQIKDIILHT